MGGWFRVRSDVGVCVTTVVGLWRSLRGNGYLAAIAVGVMLVGVAVLSSPPEGANAQNGGSSQFLAASTTFLTPPEHVLSRRRKLVARVRRDIPVRIPPAPLLLDPALSELAFNHASYLASVVDRGGYYCGHGSDPSFPAPPTDRWHNYVACGSGGADAVHTWARTPYHAPLFFAPCSSHVGFGDAVTRGGSPFR